MSGKPLLYSLFILCFLSSCGDDDAMVMPACNTGDFSIKIDSIDWEPTAHIAIMTVQDDGETQEKSLAIELLGDGEETLIIAVSNLHLLQNGEDPFAGCIRPLGYSTDPMSNNCTTFPGGSVDQCEEGGIDFFEPGHPRLSSLGVNIGSITFSSCDREQQIVSGSFDVTVKNIDQTICRRITGQFTEVCYTIQ